MQVFVAATPGQDMREGDYCHTLEGELVRLPGDSCACPDCGCDRGMAGLASSKATTTFTVVDRPDLTPALFEELFRDALDREGWIRVLPDDGWVARWASDHLRAAAGYAAGEVLGLKNGDTIFVR